ncbi:MAG: tyrosine-type recombinase/integrase [Proteobacteria bacterium]|nr:tyrosine-type recombinase/integrase [Pseudomonadota bacterium]
MANMTSIEDKQIESKQPSSSEQLVDRFLDAIWMERGLSPNTLGAYRADLMTLWRGLSENNVSIEEAQKADLLEFIARRVESGAKPRSTARQLSSFRRFFRYIMREGLRDNDPTADIAMPRIGRSLPKTLTEEEVDMLLHAPNTDEPLGHRDRAMLELLYATGLRVSELINLKQSQVNFNQGVLRIVGKGDSERLIPLGEEAQRWLRDFIDGPRMEILLERQTEYLFPTRRGGRMTRQAFWHIIKRYAKKAGIGKQLHLVDGLRDVGGVRIGHRLDDDGVAAANQNAAHVYGVSVVSCRQFTCSVRFCLSRCWGYHAHRFYRSFRLLTVHPD